MGQDLKPFIQQSYRNVTNMHEMEAVMDVLQFIMLHREIKTNPCLSPLFQVLVVLLASHCVPATDVTSLIASNYAKVFRTGSFASTEWVTNDAIAFGAWTYLRFVSETSNSLKLVCCVRSLQKFAGEQRYTVSHILQDAHAESHIRISQ